ncbi:MAG: FAD-dependent oxidoreductase [Gammaproteobacteria bacterium]
MLIIIGAGLAGYQVAREYRKLDANSPLTIITADDGRFYPKPQLSTALTSKKTSDMLASATADAMASQLKADIRTHHPVTAIDIQNKTVTVNKEIIPYDKLVLACGADVIKAPLIGDGAPDVLSVNHIYHYAQFEKLIQNKKHVTILGAGLIGCEFANDLSNAGFEVHMIAPDKYPLQRFMPEKIGMVLQSALKNNGVHFHLGSTVEQVNKNEKGYHLKLSNGETLNTEFVLSAIGLKPHIALAKTGNIKTNRGIVVNRYLESSAQEVYALGDCAEVEGHVLPFITPILNCSRALAKTLAGERTAVDYPAMPVTVKTPAHPIVICPPPQEIKGEWQIEINNNSVRALFYDEKKQLYGFVLTNEAVKERMGLVKEIPGLF